MEYVIIGAGISGLICGLELLKRGAAVTIYEKNLEEGGLVRTNFEHGFPIDTGPHLYHTVHEDILEYWRSFVGDSLVEKPFYAGNFIDEKIYDYPINKDSLARQFSSQELETIYSELASSSSEKLAAAVSYDEYVEALAGPMLAQKFFKAYPEKLWGIPTSKLSARFAPKRIEIRDDRRPFHSGGGKFAGILLDGCGQLPKKVYEEFIARGGVVNFGHQLNEISYEKNYIKKLHFSNGHNIDLNSNQLILTIPIDKISKLFGIKNDLYFRSCYCINILLKGKDPFPENYDWLYFPTADVPFHRAGLQTRFSRKGFGQDQHLLCLEIAYTEHPSIEMVHKWETDSIDFLNERKFISENNIQDIVHWDLGPLYPGYYIGHEPEVAQVKSFLDNYGNITLLGSLAEYAYADLQVLTSKAIDTAAMLSTKQNPIRKMKQHYKISSNSIGFGSHLIGAGENVFTIAEIGLNHNGSIDICKDLIKKCADAGFSAVKLQTYSKGRISRKTKAAKYYEETLDAEESISEFIDRIRLTTSELKEIWRFCKKLNIEVFSTPFDFEALETLVDLGVPGFKISSMDLVNLPLIDAVSKQGKPVILSTGMATLGEVEAALDICYNNGNFQVVLLHCVSSYPCQIENTNLSRIAALRDAFGVIVGFSDHTADIETPSIAVAAGARVIEKHVTIDNLMDGPDHSFSLSPPEFMKMIDLIKKVDYSLSNQISHTNIERNARQNLRRSVYSARFIPKGTILGENDFVVKSPGDGLDPKNISVVLNKKVRVDIDEDMPITWDAFFEN